MKLQKLFLLCILLLLSYSCVDNNAKTSENNLSTYENENLESIKKDKLYYINKGFQVYPEFDIALNFPCKLEDASLKTSGNYDLCLAGFNKNSFYQVLVKIFPTGYKNSSEEEKQEVESKFFSSFPGEKEFVVYNNHKAAVIKYNKDNLKGKALIFIKNEKSYIFNLLSSGNITSLFNSMTNNIIFYDAK